MSRASFLSRKPWWVFRCVVVAVVTIWRTQLTVSPETLSRTDTLHRVAVCIYDMGGSSLSHTLTLISPHPHTLIPSHPHTHTPHPHTHNFIPLHLHTLTIPIITYPHRSHTYIVLGKCPTPELLCVWPGGGSLSYPHTLTPSSSPSPSSHPHTLTTHTMIFDAR